MWFPRLALQTLMELQIGKLVIGQYLNGTVWQKIDNSEVTYVSNVATGTGLTGGPITTTGTIAIANTACRLLEHTVMQVQ
jgi:hypothetical protein